MFVSFFTYHYYLVITFWCIANYLKRIHITYHIPHILMLCQPDWMPSIPSGAEFKNKYQTSPKLAINCQTMSSSLSIFIECFHRFCPNSIRYIVRNVKKISLESLHISHYSGAHVSSLWNCSNGISFARYLCDATAPTATATSAATEQGNSKRTQPHGIVARKRPQIRSIYSH